jgi:hypothetical protein
MDAYIVYSTRHSSLPQRLNEPEDSQTNTSIAIAQ